MMYRFLAPVLSAQFITAATLRPAAMRNFLPRISILSFGMAPARNKVAIILPNGARPALHGAFLLPRAHQGAAAPWALTERAQNIRHNMRPNSGHKMN